MLYNRADLQIIVEPNSHSSKPYILCYQLVALLYSLPHLCFQHRALGAAFTLGLPRTSQEALGWREPTDLDTVFCFGLIWSSKTGICYVDIWEELIFKLPLKAGVGLDNSNLHVSFIFLILLP